MTPRNIKGLFYTQLISSQDYEQVGRYRRYLYNFSIHNTFPDINRKYIDKRAILKLFQSYRVCYSERIFKHCIAAWWNPCEAIGLVGKNLVMPEIAGLVTCHTEHTASRHSSLFWVDICAWNWSTRVVWYVTGLI